MTPKAVLEAIDKYKITLEFDGAEGGWWWATSVNLKYDDIGEKAKSVTGAVFLFVDEAKKLG